MKSKSSEDHKLNDIGSKLSQLSLSMLSKKHQDKHEQGPENRIMMQMYTPEPVPIDVKLVEIQEKGMHRLGLRMQDSEDVNDVLTYASTRAKNEDDDDESVFSAGGAIMEALAEKDPAAKPAVKKTASAPTNGKELKLGFTVQPVVVKNNKIVNKPLTLVQQRAQA